MLAWNGDDVSLMTRAPSSRNVTPPGIDVGTPARSARNGEFTVAPCNGSLPAMRVGCVGAVPTVKFENVSAVAPVAVSMTQRAFNLCGPAVYVAEYACGGVGVFAANLSSTSQVTSPVAAGASVKSALNVAGCVDPANATPATVNVGVAAADAVGVTFTRPAVSRAADNTIAKNLGRARQRNRPTTRNPQYQHPRGATARDEAAEPACGPPVCDRKVILRSCRNLQFAW
jgi:hypothetical protein